MICELAYREKKPVEKERPYRSAQGGARSGPMRKAENGGQKMGVRHEY
jgi:hypothetical protein